MYMAPHMSSVHGGKTRALDTWQLELQWLWITTWVLAMETRSSKGTAHVPNYWTISPSLCLFLYVEGKEENGSAGAWILLRNVNEMMRILRTCRVLSQVPGNAGLLWVPGQPGHSVRLLLKTRTQKKSCFSLLNTFAKKLKWFLQLLGLSRARYCQGLEFSYWCKVIGTLTVQVWCWSDKRGKKKESLCTVT